MKPPTHANLITKCQYEIGQDNLEKCVSILSENFPGNHEVILFSRRLKQLEREGRMGTHSRESLQLDRNIISSDLLSFLSSLGDEEQEMRMIENRLETNKNQLSQTCEHLIEESESPVLVGIHDRILIVSCPNSPTNWKRLFPEDRFTHVGFMEYKGQIPEKFKNPDVVIFDDWNCPGLLGNRTEIKRLAQEMPLAHLLYFGDTNKNPFTDSKLKDEQEIYARMTNANSHLTIHGRLNDLLEYRKNFGLPMSTHLSENMKDKLPIRVFISYSHHDEPWKNDLDMHLATMKRQGLITVWQDRKIAPGAEWDEEIRRQMEQSHLIFFMVSPGFMASEYIMEKEVPTAMSLYDEGKAKVLPIFVKDVEWKGSVFGKLQGLPRDQKFLDLQSNKDQALATVAREIRNLIENWDK